MKPNGVTQASGYPDPVPRAVKIFQINVVVCEKHSSLYGDCLVNLSLSIVESLWKLVGSMVGKAIQPLPACTSTP
jgi:hypothetical protein